MITKNSKHKEFVEMVKKKAPCAAGIDQMEEWAAQNPEMTSAEAMELSKRTNNSIPSEWAVWVLGTFYDQLDEDIRMIFFEFIKKPDLAYYAYTNFSNLTNKEDKYLEKIFKDKIPEKEKDLKDGKIKRKKNG